MARHNSLLLGPKAKGTIGDQITFSGWKGIPVAKTKPVPSNPNTAGQQTQRGYMKDAVDAWHLSDRTGDDRTAYTRLASRDSRPLSGFNAFTSQYINVVVAGDTYLDCYGVSASRSDTTLTVAGSADADQQVKVTVVTDTYTYVTEKTGTPSTGSFSIEITLYQQA